MTMFRYIILGLLLMIALPKQAKAQFYSVRANGLLAMTGTLNVSLDMSISPKTSIDLGVYVNPIKTETLSLAGVAFQPGLRFWRFEPNAGMFWGTHLSFAAYDVGDKESTRKGFLAGPGVSWGYCWLISKRFSIGVELGIGILYMKDTKKVREPYFTEDEYIYHSERITIAPTKIDVSFIYLF